MLAQPHLQIEAQVRSVALEYDISVYWTDDCPYVTCYACCAVLGLSVRTYVKASILFPKPQTRYSQSHWNFSISLHDGPVLQIYTLSKSKLSSSTRGCVCSPCPGPGFYGRRHAWVGRDVHQPTATLHASAAQIELVLASLSLL